jgi:hypothetical protein
MELRELHLQIGNLVGPNSVLTSVRKWIPSKPVFPISEQAYILEEQSDALSAKHTVSFSGDSLDLIPTDGSTYPRKGQILLSDRQLDRVIERPLNDAAVELVAKLETSPPARAS